MQGAIWAYPWDLLDEGVGEALGRIADAGIKVVSVAAAYHAIRALCPHNPRRAVYHGEDGVLYFQPNWIHFRDTPIQPVVSQLAAHGDPFTRFSDAAASAGLKLRAWTVLTHNSRLGTVYPDCTLQNAFGDSYPFGLCPAHPDVRTYICGIVRSLGEMVDVDAIELESLGYMGIDHSGHHAKQGVELNVLQKYLLSLCFCEHCCKAMEAQGVDTVEAAAEARREIRSVFEERGVPRSPDPRTGLNEVLGEERAAGIVQAREHVVLSLLDELRIKVDGPERLSLMVTPNPLSTGAQAGVSLPDAGQSAGRFLHQAFARETTAVAGAVSQVVQAAGGVPVTAGLQAIVPFVTTAEELEDRVRAVREAGASDVQFYHYGLMPLENLGWIKEALSSKF